MLLLFAFFFTVSVGQWAREPALQLDQHGPSPQPAQESPVGGDGVPAVGHTLKLQPQQQGAISGPARVPAGAHVPPAWLQRHHFSPPWPLLRRCPPDHTIYQRSGRGRNWGGAALFLSGSCYNQKKRGILMMSHFSSFQIKQVNIRTCLSSSAKSAAANYLAEALKFQLWWPLKIFNQLNLNHGQSVGKNPALFESREFVCVHAETTWVICFPPRKNHLNDNIMNTAGHYYMENWN